MISRRAAVVATLIVSSSVMGDDAMKALDLARNEGYVWLVLDTCFAGAPDKRDELKSLSTRYLRTLSASINISLAELRQAVEAGVVEAGQRNADVAGKCAALKGEMEASLRQREADRVSVLETGKPVPAE